MGEYILLALPLPYTLLTLELSINSYKNESATQIFVDADDDNDDAKASAGKLNMAHQAGQTRQDTLQKPVNEWHMATAILKGRSGRRGYGMERA